MFGIDYNSLWQRMENTRPRQDRVSGSQTAKNGCTTEDYSMNELRTCRQCGRELPATTDFFWIKRTKTDWLNVRCRECCGSKFNDPVPEGMKRCSKCKRNLPADRTHFYASKYHPNGFKSGCKECHGSEFSIAVGYKRCTVCKRELLATPEFFAVGMSRHGKACLRSPCHECKTKVRTEWRHNNIERDRANSRNSYKRN